MQTTGRGNRELVAHGGHDGAAARGRIMTSLRVLLSRLMGRGRSAGELESEIRDHLGRLTAEYERSGLSRGEAEAAARRAFGAVTQLQEDYREQRRLAFFD